MKRVAKLLGVFAVTLLLLVVTGLAGAITDTLVFYARVAKLYTQEPETKIAMPFKT